MRRIRSLLSYLMRRVCIGSPHRLWLRYAVGFAFIFATISVSHWASLATIKAAKDDAEVLSVSSRQRVLSQRILFLMTEMESDPMAFIRLEAALNLFEASHNYLVNLPDLSPELLYLYFEDEPISLDAFSRRFIQAVGIAITSDASRADEMRDVLADWGKEDLILSLAAASTLFRDVSEAKIKRLQRIQHVSLAMALIVLLLEALLIFLPAHVSVTHAIAKLEVRKKLMRRSLLQVKAQNKELLRARRSLTHAANHDTLTGLANRRAVYDCLSSVGETPRACDLTRCVMKIDLDLFKNVNDTLGHNAGDQVLVRVADILRSQASPGDIVGRIGGDEFVMITDEPTSLDAMLELGRRIVDAVSEPCLIDGTQCKISASIGFTIASIAQATPDQMLIEADLALYEAKRHGRCTVRAYSDALAAEVESRRILFHEIKTALSRDQFEPFFQPQISLDTGRLCGCEVLARWRHPVHGLVSPATFIAAAEEAGLVDQIDQTMVEKGLDFLEECRASGIDIPIVSVNASPATLRDPYLTDRLLQEVRARHLSPDDLTVEVLEDTLIDGDDDVALQTLQRLSQEGFAVVLDDFGTGYASMSNLSRLQLDGIKIDQSLVKPVPDPRADSIISALVSLTRDLGMKIVAEGVETEEHCAVVSNLGCRIVQGYAISKPLAQADFLAWYASFEAERMPIKRGA